MMSKRDREIEEVMEDIMTDPNFQIVSESHRKGLVSLMGNEAVRTLEDFLEARKYDRDFYSVTPKVTLRTS